MEESNEKLRTLSQPRRGTPSDAAKRKACGSQVGVGGEVERPLARSPALRPLVALFARLGGLARARRAYGREIPLKCGGISRALAPAYQVLGDVT